MKSLARRNAKLARLEASRKALLQRTRAKRTARLIAVGAPSLGGKTTAKIVRTCECGRVVKGNAFFTHRAVCAVVRAAASSTREPKEK